MNSTSNCTGLNTYPSNSDVTGLGVRVGLYCSLLVGIGASYFSESQKRERLLDGACTWLVTSAGMVIGGILSLCEDQEGLSLPDAQIIVLYCVAGAATWAGASAGYEPELRDRTGALLHLALSGAFGILVFARAETFGGAAFLPECLPNSAFLFVLFGKYLSATDTILRAFSLVIFSLAECVVLWRSIVHFLPHQPNSLSRGLRLSFSVNLERSGTYGSSKWPMLQTAISIVVWIICIVTIESTFRANDLLTGQDSSSQLSFGQALPVVLLLLQVLGLLADYMEWKKSTDEPQKGHPLSRSASNQGTGTISAPVTEEPEATHVATPAQANTSAHPTTVVTVSGRSDSTGSEHLVQRQTTMELATLGERPTPASTTAATTVTR